MNVIGEDYTLICPKNALKFEWTSELPRCIVCEKNIRKGNKPIMVWKNTGCFFSGFAYVHKGCLKLLPPTFEDVRKLMGVKTERQRVP